MSQTIGVPRETFAGEKRVATVPDVVEKLVKLGFGVTVETGAGAAANFDDASYEAAGARIAGGAAELYAGSDLIFKVRAPTPGEIALTSAPATSAALAAAWASSRGVASGSGRLVGVSASARLGTIASAKAR